MSIIFWSLAGIITIYLAFRIRGSVLKSALAKERAEAGLPTPTDRCEVMPDGSQTAHFKCGHDGPKAFTVHLYGDTLTPTKKALSSREMCPECVLNEMRQLIIRCALCGLPILPGSPVALYAGPSSAFTKAWTTKVGGQAVGCLRWDCCPSGGFFAGHWTAEGFRSAFGAGSAAAEAMASGNVVVVGDVSDPSSISVTQVQPTDEGDNSEE